MRVRKSQSDDLERMLEIYAYAREQMVLTGNPTQWGDSYPAKSLLENDIASGHSYVVVDDSDDSDDGEIICGTFAFILGDDPTYQVIEGGAWLNDLPYGTIHRIASGGVPGKHGILSCALDYCVENAPSVRIDTHHDNKIMQRLLEGFGFIPCGTIYVADGSPRIAYHR